MRRSIFLLLAAVAPFRAQTVINGSRVLLGSWDAGQAASVRPFKMGEALPSSCRPGEAFFATAAGAGRNLYLCNPADTWVPAGSGAAPWIILQTQTIGAGPSQIPAASSCADCIVIVKDAASESDCSAGGGISVSLCRSNGTAWAGLGSAGGGGAVNSGVAGQLAYYAANGAAVSGTDGLPDGTTATTRAQGDNSTHLATTAYADAAASTRAPATSGTALLKGNGAGGTAAAAAADIVGLFGSCAGAQYLGADGSCHAGATNPRGLNGQGISAKCQPGMAAAAYSLPASGAPAAVCEPDGIQAYVSFAPNTAQAAYDRFDLPSDWAGSLRVVVTAYSASTNAPSVTVQLSCISTGAMASPQFGTAQSINLTPAPSNGRTSATTTLQTSSAYANRACAAGDAVVWKLAVTAAAAADLRVLSVRFTE